MLKSISFAVGCALVAIGFPAFFLSAALGTSRDPHLNLPASAATALATADDRLCLALPRFSRVQLYDASGNFLRGIGIDGDGGDFHLWSTGDAFYVATARTNQLIRIDPHGGIAAVTRAAELTSYANSLSGSIEGRHFRLAPSALRGATTYVVTNGRSAPLIIEPAVTRFLGIPFQQWALAVAGGLLANFGYRRPRQAIDAD
jgi:hypothetical protein